MKSPSRGIATRKGGYLVKGHSFILARTPSMTDDCGVTTEIQLDDETRAALLLFNERLEQTAAEERVAKRIAKAERAKDEAAGLVRKLGSDNSATAEQKSEAEAAYKAAVEDLARVKENPDPPPEAVDEPEPTEMSADEEPALASEAPDESE